MPKMNARYFSLISILWLPVTLFWSAVMTQVLEERVQHFVPEQKGLYIALIGALGAVAATVIELIIGPISDNCTHRDGRRTPFVRWGILLNTIPIMTFAFSQSFFQLLVSFVLIQLLINVGSGPYQALIPDLVPPQHQGRASSWMGFWTLIGQIIGLIVSGLFLARGMTNTIMRQHLPPSQEASLGVVIICLFCATALLICLFVNLRVVKETPLTQGRVLPISGALRESFNLLLARYPDFARLLYSRFVFNMGIYSAIQFLRYYVSDTLPLDGRDESIETMWIALAATLGGVPGTFVAGYFADRISKRRIIYVSCCFTSAAAVLFCLSYSIWAVRIIGFIFGIGYGAFCAVDWALKMSLA